MPVKLSKSWWNKLSTQLYTSFGGAVLLVIGISLLAVFVLNRIKDVQHEISDKSMPDMQAAFSIAQQTATLVAAVPQLATVDMPEQLEKAVAIIRQREEAFKAQLSTMLEKQGEREYVQKIQDDGLALIQNIDRIRELVRERFDLRHFNLVLRDELYIIQDELMAVLEKGIDDQMFYTITGYRSLDGERSPRETHFSEAEIQAYRYLVELREAATVNTQLLATAFTVTDVAQLEPLREQFEAIIDLATRSLGALEGHPLHDQLSAFSLALFSIGQREGNGFDLRHRELAVGDEMSELLNDSQALEVDIVALVQGIVNDSSLAAIEMAGEATRITKTSATLLLLINIVSIAGAILIGWLFVERHLIRRLARISKQIKHVAAGNLESPIDVSGRDEIASLAKALEVFRQNALEVQRLSLVEQLANELKEMNNDLETANKKLKQAQDQIVMQKKLAALGELTAGVAHEIKNPMNFIMNFAQVSQDLLKELLEETAKVRSSGDTKEEYDSQLVDEVAEDLTSNLKRIYENGARANRIVVDMLKMGRGSGDWQMTGINVLLNEHAMLAFHSARAVDPEFQLTIQEDYSTDVGEAMVRPQDLGRVFLNLVTNACYATEEKRKSFAAEAGTGVESYQPTLKLSTRLAGGCVEVHIRDNGNGISESALEHIFNPFFTTKPPDKGTGLGLSMSSDTVREHGGDFRVDTKEGEYTEMIVVLPIECAAHRITDAAGDGSTEEAAGTGGTASL